MPIHKSGSKQDVTNYRPICKIPLIPKLLDKIVASKISPVIDSLFCDEQHGFRVGRSTMTNLALFCNQVINNFNRNLQTDVIFTDFSKAFDKVNHTLLLYKLSFLGFKLPLLNWF